MYVATPDGQLLAGGYNCVETLPQFRALLKKALGDYKPAKVAVIRPGKSSPFVKPPEGGLVVNVYAKVLGNYKESDYKESPTYVLRYLKAYQSSIGRDHLWVWKEEHEALARGIVPDSVKRRIARCHLDDSTVGSFPGWKRQEVKKVELTLRDGRLTGSVLVETADRKRGYDAEVQVLQRRFPSPTSQAAPPQFGQPPLAVADGRPPIPLPPPLRPPQDLFDVPLAHLQQVP